MVKKKLKWTDTDDIAFELIDRYPSTDPMRLSLSEIAKRIQSLPSFGGGAKANDDALATIQKSWFEERTDMEDELGPLTHVAGETEDLDEDEYRDDRMTDDEEGDDALDAADADADEEEEEFGEGFQEEEVDD